MLGIWCRSERVRVGVGVLSWGHAMHPARQGRRKATLKHFLHFFREMNEREQVSPHFFMMRKGRTFSPAKGQYASTAVLVYTSAREFSRAPRCRADTRTSRREWRERERKRERHSYVRIISYIQRTKHSSLQPCVPLGATAVVFAHFCVHILPTVHANSSDLWLD